MPHTIKHLVRTLMALACVACLPTGASAETPAADFKVEETEFGLRITDHGKPVADYHKFNGTRPILWPLYGPDQTEMTRGYPMREATAAEKADHPWHRSLWIAHGDVNGVDFWAEGEKCGTVHHGRFEQIASGSSAVFEAVCDWLGPDGTKMMTDRRRFTISGTADRRIVDIEVQLIASEGDVVLGDTKEGTVAMRVAGWMKEDAKKGGELVNEHGDRGNASWGKPARWVDYSAPNSDGNMVGITFMNHPKSFNHPTRWHIRTYGLYAANPFGVHHFTGEKEKTAGVRLSKGESLTLLHRLILHRDRPNAEQINQAFEEYAQSK